MNREYIEAENAELTSIGKHSYLKSFDFLLLPSVTAFLIGMFGWNWLVGMVSAGAVSIFLVAGGFRKTAKTAKFVPILVIILLSVFVSYVGVVYYQFKNLNDEYISKSGQITATLAIVPGDFFRAVKRYNRYSDSYSETMLFESTIKELDKALLERQKLYQDKTTPEALNIPLVWGELVQCQNEQFDALRAMMYGPLDFAHGKINSIELNNRVDAYKIYSHMGPDGRDVGKCSQIQWSIDKNLKHFGMCLYSPCVKT